jgi:hypothetical protein
VGAGKNYQDKEYAVCGETMNVPSYGQICVEKNALNDTVCTSHNFKRPQCDSSLSSPHFLVKLDTYGDGWGSGVKYVIKDEATSATVLTGNPYTYPNPNPYTFLNPIPNLISNPKV